MIELAAPAPIGIGSPECEALSSFVQRIAYANGTYPGQLVHRLFGWLESRTPSRIGTWQHHPRRILLGRNINGFGLAESWLELIQQTVHLKPLSKLTVNQWGDAFPTRGFLQQNLSWCPLCLIGDTIPFHRLTWMLQSFEICPIHHIRMSTTCPHCGRQPPVLHDRSHVEICPWCAGDLRACPDAQETNDQILAEEELGLVVQHFGICDEYTTWKSRHAIRALSRFAGINNPHALSRRIGTSKVTTHGWWHGTNRISLPFALETYARLGVRFSSAICHRKLLPLSANQTNFHLRSRKPPKRIRWDVIAEQLFKVASDPISTAPKFIDVATKLGIQRRTLRAHFPELCRRISRNYRKRMATERIERDRVLRCQIAETIVHLRSKGMPYRPIDIERTLKRPRLFNSNYARRAFQQVSANFAIAAASPKPADLPR